MCTCVCERAYYIIIILHAADRFNATRLIAGAKYRLGGPFARSHRPAGRPLRDRNSTSAGHAAPTVFSVARTVFYVPRPAIRARAHVAPLIYRIAAVLLRAPGISDAYSKPVGIYIFFLFFSPSDRHGYFRLHFRRGI